MTPVRTFTLPVVRGVLSRLGFCPYCGDRFEFPKLDVVQELAELKAWIASSVIARRRGRRGRERAHRMSPTTFTPGVPTPTFYKPTRLPESPPASGRRAKTGGLHSFLSGRKTAMPVTDVLDNLTIGVTERQLDILCEALELADLTGDLDATSAEYGELYDRLLAIGTEHCGGE